VLLLLTHGSRLPVEFVQFLDGADLLLLLHASVLEPDLDLALGEVERHREFDATSTRQVAAVVELLLELEGLMTGVRLATTSTLRRVRSCSVFHTTQHVVNVYTYVTLTLYSAVGIIVLQMPWSVQLGNLHELQWSSA